MDGYIYYNQFIYNNSITNMDKQINNIYFAIVILGLILVYATPIATSQVVKVDNKIHYYMPNDSFSKESLLKELDNLEIHHKDIVYAQARLETGNFKSDVFLKHRNLFGWKLNGGYKHYESWKKSLFDYKLFQHKYYKSGEDYFKFLTRTRFCEADSVYKKRILSCIK